MSEQIILLVEMLKERINLNFRIIYENEETIKRILVQPYIENRSELISKNYNMNRKLREENRELVKLHAELINYLNKFKEVYQSNPNDTTSKNFDFDPNSESLSDEQKEAFSPNKDNESDEDNYIFIQTISGELVFETSHPKFNDDKFFKKLLNHYQLSENYEMCTFLLKLKGKK